MLFRLNVLIVLFFTVFFSFLEAHEKKTICLNMIVKNENSIIKDCLKSVCPFIDYWVIVDTGSNDGTQSTIKQYLSNIPGELHERKWVNFSHNRNEALMLAKNKADYILIIDADDHLECDSKFKMPHLNLDSYYFQIEDVGTQYFRRHLIKSNLDWKWKGVIHEYLFLDHFCNEATLENLIYKRGYKGSRSQDPHKYEKDAQLLEKALQEEPDNSRYRFYLAQSYKNANQYEKAIENYTKRAEMKGWDQEVYYSLLQSAILSDYLEKPFETVIEGYFKAFLFRPQRAESLYYLSNYLRKKGRYFEALCITEQGLKTPLAQDSLFVEKWIYDYGMLFDYSLNAYWSGKYLESEQASFRLLENPFLPENYRKTIHWNLSWIEAKLAEKKP